MRLTLVLLTLLLISPLAYADPAEDFARGQAAYEDGNHQDAVKWYRKAAEQGLAEAQYLLGQAFRLGEGTAINHKTSLYWYRKAAAQGQAGAQVQLGFVYMLGQGVVKNEAEGYKWLLLASAQGEASAKRGMDFAEKMLTPAEREKGQEEAARWQAAFEKRQK